MEATERVQRSKWKKAERPFVSPCEFPGDILPAFFVYAEVVLCPMHPCRFLVAPLGQFSALVRVRFSVANRALASFLRTWYSSIPTLVHLHHQIKHVQNLHGFQLQQPSSLRFPWPFLFSGHEFLVKVCVCFSSSTVARKILCYGRFCALNESVIFEQRASSVATSRWSCTSCLSPTGTPNTLMKVYYIDSSPMVDERNEPMRQLVPADKVIGIKPHYCCASIFASGPKAPASVLFEEF